MKPIAWYDPTNGAVSRDKDSPLFTPLGQVLPLYTQRTWVGLTDDELFKIWMGAPAETEDRFAFVNAVISKLKEKNT
jgi:hypothetical protein